MRPHRWPQLVVPTFTSPEGPPLLIQFPKDQRTIRFTCLGHPSEGLATGKGPRACLFPGQGQAWDPAGRRAPAGKACLHLPAQHPAPRAPLPAVHGTLAPRHRRCAVRPPLHTAMGLELYLDLLSQPCRAVYIFAKKNGIPFELRPVELLKGQHLTGALFQKSSSLRRLPTLKDGDFVLTESVAIMIYLSFKYQTAEHWYPPDLQARARIHEYLGWHADCIRGVFGVPLWTKVLAPLIGVQVPEEKVQHNRIAMDQALQVLQDKFLGDRAFLTGQQVALADLLVLEELMQPVAIGYDLFEGRPQLTAWRERVETFLGTDLLQEAHSSILNVMERVANKTFLEPLPEAYPFMLLRISKIP